MAKDSDKYVDYLDSLRFSWKRPEGPTLIWQVVDGKRESVIGRIPKFSIQEVPRQLEEEVVEFMVQHYLVEESISLDQDSSLDPLSLREIRTLWRELVRLGVSMVALVLNPDPRQRPVIAGVNLVFVVSEGDEDISSMMKLQSKKIQKIMTLHRMMIRKSDVFRKYGVDKCLRAIDICIHPSFKGQGLEEEILRAREDLGRAYRIPVSESIFTAPDLQILASRLGYKILLDSNYSEFVDEEGNLIFPRSIMESVKVMAKELY